MTRQQLQAEQADLTRKLAVREGAQGYTANVKSIKARLAWIEEELNKQDG